MNITLYWELDNNFTNDKSNAIYSLNKNGGKLGAERRIIVDKAQKHRLGHKPNNRTESIIFESLPNNANGRFVKKFAAMLKHSQYLRRNMYITKILVDGHELLNPFAGGCGVVTTTKDPFELAKKVKTFINLKNQQIKIQDKTIYN